MPLSKRLQSEMRARDVCVLRAVKRRKAGMSFGELRVATKLTSNALRGSLRRLRTASQVKACGISRNTLYGAMTRQPS
jgi:predicted transcriptional regulator